MTDSLPPGLPLDADGKWRGVIDDPGIVRQTCDECGERWQGVHECELRTAAEARPLTISDQWDPREHGHWNYHRWCGRCRRLLRRYARAQTPWWGV